jgi:hypothetical protein
MSTLANYLGSGITFPIELDNTGKPIIKTGKELIQSSIKMIWGWPEGHRIFLGQFGSRISEILEEPNDEVLMHMVRFFVSEGITKWEKRIRISDISIVSNSPEIIEVSVTYNIINSQQQDTFIYPFYKETIY